MAKMGRPKKEIDKKELDTVTVMATMYTRTPRKAIVNYFDWKLGGCSDDTIDRYVKAEYDCTFADYIDKRKDVLKMKLAKTAMKMSEKSGAVLIFLLKNVLGMTDKIEEIISEGQGTKRIEIKFTDDKESGDHEN